MSHADTSQVAAQALEIADGWSTPDAPPSWRLTAETFRAIGEEPALLDLAAEIPADRLPPLLLAAAVQHLVGERAPEPLASFYPRPGLAQPPLDGRFRPAFVEFCQAEHAALLALCAQHRYQMNEVGRSAGVVPVLARIAEEYERPLVLIDLGTGAGLGLQVDRYRYRYTAAPDRGGGVPPDSAGAGKLGAGSTGDGGASFRAETTVVGDPTAPLELQCEVRGEALVPVPIEMPTIVDRVGVDVEPLDLGDAAVREWITACIPPEAGAVTRFARAVEIARARPERYVRGPVNTV